MLRCIKIRGAVLVFPAPESFVRVTLDVVRHGTCRLCVEASEEQSRLKEILA